MPLEGCLFSLNFSSSFFPSLSLLSFQQCYFRSLLRLFIPACPVPSLPYYDRLFLLSVHFVRYIMRFASHCLSPFLPLAVAIFLVGFSCRSLFSSISYQNQRGLRVEIGIVVLVCDSGSGGNECCSGNGVSRQMILRSHLQTEL